ncbi:hypothetical protein OH77DRAFT_275096 [Trametes cingulata]|nr:hypothetical protein OH77DRAFT_275096 [Trametes cingulata]
MSVCLSLSLSGKWAIWHCWHPPATELSFHLSFCILHLPWHRSCTRSRTVLVLRQIVLLVSSRPVAASLSRVSERNSSRHCPPCSCHGTVGTKLRVSSIAPPRLEPRANSGRCCQSLARGLAGPPLRRLWRKAGTPSACRDSELRKRRDGSG